MPRRPRRSKPTARLRDVGRFGLFVLEDGVMPGWRDLAGRPDCAKTGFGRLAAGRPRPSR